MKTFQLGANVATLTQISQALSDLLPKLKPAGAVPAGCIAHFHTVPDGWLLCNGAAVSRTTYANLFAVIGTKYGTGDGSTTFNLPNLAGRFLESTTNASEVGTMKEAGLPNITGTGSGTSHHAFQDAFEGYGNTSPLAGANNGGGVMAFRFEARRISSIYGASGTVQPLSARLLPCVKI